MTEHPLVTSVRFSAAPRRDVAAGLLGFVSLEYAGIKLDGIALRRSATGKLVLSFPERTDSRGKRRPHFHPRNSEVHLEILRQVLAALGLDRDRDEAGS
jgi:hypothetical protein